MIVTSDWRIQDTARPGRNKIFVASDRVSLPRLIRWIAVDSMPIEETKRPAFLPVGYRHEEGEQFAARMLPIGPHPLQRFAFRMALWLEVLIDV